MQQQLVWAAAACVLSQPLTFNRSGLLVTGPHTVSSETGDKRVGFLTNKEYLTGAVTNIGMHNLPLVLSLTEEENNTSGFSSR